MLSSAEKVFSCSTQLSMKFALLINLKLLTVANSFLLNVAEHENFSANIYENANYCWHFHIYCQRKFYAQLSCTGERFYNLGAGMLGGIHSVHFFSQTDPSLLLRVVEGDTVFRNKLRVHLYFYKEASNFTDVQTRYCIPVV